MIKAYSAHPGDIYWRAGKPANASEKMLLYTVGGVAAIGTWYGEVGQYFTHHCPLPKLKHEHTSVKTRRSEKDSHADWCTARREYVDEGYGHRGSASDEQSHTDASATRYLSASISDTTTTYSGTDQSVQE